ncbi:MAG TPA: SIR2 family protein [Acidobacteriaceae bacterium]|nr:SIR2 family protein [Acidobacteriaceae bacterium]
MQSIRDRRIILFAGAGLSMYLGLPSWNGLMRILANDLGFDEDLFVAFGDYLSVAEYYKQTVGDLGDLRSRLDRAWHSNPEIVTTSRVHNAILSMAFPIIYTTNFDRLIEFAYKLSRRPYSKVVTVRHMVAADPTTTQIIKFHGDFDSDDSLVFTESDYFERLQFESPLDIRLRSDLLGRSVLFIGYSLTDINVRLMLYRLTKMWSLDPKATSRPPSYIFLARPSVVEEHVLRARGITVLSSDEDDPQNALAQFLEELSALVAS